MKEATEKAVELLSEKILEGVKADDALKYTQSALNLAHVLAILDNIKSE